MNLKSPHYIKIDVDGIEHLIISSLDGLLHNTKSILVEVDKKFISNLNSIEKFLTKNNFKLKKIDNEKKINLIKFGINDMTKITVLGGSGFLGSHLCDLLSEKNFNVTIFDKNKSKYKNKNKDL